MKSIYNSGKLNKPFYKIFICSKKIKSIKNKRADKIIEELVHYNLRIYKDGKRQKIGSLRIILKTPNLYEGLK